MTGSLGRTNTSMASVESTRHRDRLHPVRGLKTACTSSCLRVWFALLFVPQVLSGAQAQVAVLKEREGEFVEPVLVSADLYHIVTDCPCAPLEGPFLHDNLLLDAAPLPACL